MKVLSEAKCMFKQNNKRNMMKTFYRIYQGIMKVAMNFVPYNKPKVYYGEEATREMSQDIAEIHKNILLVTDAGVRRLGLINSALAALSQNGVEVAVFDKVNANPTIKNVEDGLKAYESSGSTAIIAIGGGSAIDCAKLIGARANNPNKSVRQMRGIMKLRHALPPLFAVPTTSGTGSETTLAAVVIDSHTKEKFAVMDPKLVPKFAVLDPNMTLSLPPHLTASTGMDALTHAIESFVGRSNTHETKEYATNATKLIFENLETAFLKPFDMKARQNMMIASFEAGLAFTRAYVGNVHAIAHTLGGEYNVAHGLANAIILPKVLSFYGEKIYKKIGTLCNEINLFPELVTNEEKTLAFIQKIKDMNKLFGFPQYIEELKEEDIPKLVRRAKKEANPLYPVPVIFMDEEFGYIFHSLLAPKK